MATTVTPLTLIMLTWQKWSKVDFIVVGLLIKFAKGHMKSYGLSGLHSNIHRGPPIPMSLEHLLFMAHGPLHKIMRGPTKPGDRIGHPLALTGTSDYGALWARDPR